MGAFSDYMETQIVQHFLRNTVYTPSATLYLALFESDPGEAAGGTEASFTGYARQAIAFTAIAGGQTTNSLAITFPANTGGTSPVITHIAVVDAASGAHNRLLYSVLTASKTLAPGDVLAFAANAIAFTLD